LAKRHTAEEWADSFDIEIFSYDDATDFYPEKLCTFAEFSQKAMYCTLCVKDRHKWLLFLSRCERGK
jgi:hypothetical protein